VKTLTRHAKGAGLNISNHVRATKKALAQLGASLKSKGKGQKSQLKKTLQRTMDLATDTVKQCQKAIRQSSKDALENFEQDLRIAEEILAQTEQKLKGASSIPERIVSLYDPEARPIRKGKLKKPNEFGRTLQIVQDSSGVILDHELHHGNPSDKTQLLPLVKKFKKRFGRAPSDLATDKGYYSQENIERLRSLKVKRIAIPKIGRLTKQEKKKQHSRWFKGLQRFHCGLEAGISMLKRCFLLGDLQVRGTKATAVCVNWAILSYNLWQMA
jgi:IS5 family transposase